MGELGKPRDRGLALPIELGDLRLGILDCASKSMAIEVILDAAPV